jgi:hypothetical protein
MTLAHEIKHDGYRMQVRRDATATCLSSPTNHAVLVGDRINQLRRDASAVSAAQ